MKYQTGPDQQVSTLLEYYCELKQDKHVAAGTLRVSGFDAMRADTGTAEHLDILGMG